MLLGLPILRLRGDYLAIVTLGFGEIVRIILLNWADDRRAERHRQSAAPRPLRPLARSIPVMKTFAGFFAIDYAPAQRVIFQYYVICTGARTNALVNAARRRPIGRAWEALRKMRSPPAPWASTLAKVKLAAFGVGAMLAGFAGAFFAARQGFTMPGKLTF